MGRCSISKYSFGDLFGKAQGKNEQQELQESKGMEPEELKRHREINKTSGRRQGPPQHDISGQAETRCHALYLRLQNSFPTKCDENMMHILGYT